MEQPVAGRGRGRKILRASMIAGAVGIAPLLLYTLLGPADGNPVGLGLLAILAMGIAVVGGLIGAVTAGVEYIRRTRS